MQRYVLYCSKCARFFSKNTNNPNEAITCETCNSILKYSGITKTEWDEKTNEDKEQIKKEFAEKYAIHNTTITTEDSILFELQAMRKDIHTILSIVTFMFALGVIVVFIMILFYRM